MSNRSNVTHWRDQIKIYSLKEDDHRCLECQTNNILTPLTQTTENVLNVTSPENVSVIWTKEVANSIRKTTNVL